MLQLYTIGHGQLGMAEIFAVLKPLSIRIIVDIRTRMDMVTSGNFTESEVRVMAESQAMDYHWAGRQLQQQFISNKKSIHSALHTPLQSFADRIVSEGFQRSMAQLISLAHKAPLVILAKEVEISHCARRIIADYLTLQACLVTHLYADKQAELHSLSTEARRESAALIYDRHAKGAK